MSSINLCLGGDCMIGRSFNDLFQYSLNFSIWGNLLPLLETEVDIFGVNLETTLTDSDTPWIPKVFNYKLSPQYADKLYPVQYASISNNHILDYRLPGLIDTMNTLDNLNIAYAGAGINKQQAMQPTIIGDIGFLSAADHYDYWAAGKPLPPQKGKEGIFYIDIEHENWNEALEAVHKLRKDPKVKTIVFSLHWGGNWEPVISPQRKRLAYELLHNGVDIIHGHSSHHIQKVEEMNGGICFYGMGDLIDDYAVDENFRSNVAFISNILIKNSKIEDVEIHPTKIKHTYSDDILYAQVNFTEEEEDINWVKNNL